MAGVYYNITGSTGVDVELLAPGDGMDNISSIMLTNIHDTADATVSLFFQNNPIEATATTIYIIHTVAIPSDTSLLLDNEALLYFDNSASGFGLYITVGSSDTVDILINT